MKFFQGIRKSLEAVYKTLCHRKSYTSYTQNKKYQKKAFFSFFGLFQEPFYAQKTVYDFWLRYTKFFHRDMKFFQGIRSIRNYMARLFRIPAALFRIPGLRKSFFIVGKGGVKTWVKHPKCSRCGECCGNLLPLAVREVAEIQRYVKRYNIKEQKHFVPADAPVVDYVCPFYDSENKRCVIYAVRPVICREYQCDKAASGKEMDRAVYHGQMVRIVNMRETFFGKER